MCQAGKSQDQQHRVAGKAEHQSEPDPDRAEAGAERE
jgi:hypothetical protein